jgi:hypothetical protein
VCLKAEDHQLTMETVLERDMFLMSLITNVVKPGEAVTIQELIDRSIQHDRLVLDEYELTAKVT